MLHWWYFNNYFLLITDNTASNARKRKIELSGASTSQEATASTSGLTNRSEIPSTSGLINGYSELTNRPAIASTSGLTNGYSELTNGPAIASTSRQTNGQADELNYRPSNRFINGISTRVQNNTSSPQFHNNNVRQSNGRQTLRTVERRESVRLINNNRETRLRSQPSTSANSDAIIISDESDSEDDVQVFYLYFYSNDSVM